MSSPEAGAVDVQDAARPRRILSRLDAVMITVGIVIGAGIFKAPSTVAQMSGSVEWMFIAWLAGGVLSLIGALCYAELATAYPSSGGDYHFITRVYGKDVSFFFAWARATVIVTGSIALLAYTLGDYLTRVVDLGRHSAAIYAAAAVIVLTLVNVAGLKTAVRTQGLFTAIEVAGVLLVAAAGWWIWGGTADAAPAVAGPSGGAPPATFGLAMVFVLLTYGGWNEAAYVSAELRGGSRSIVSVLVMSLLLITAVYLLCVFGATAAVGFEGLKSSAAIGADVMEAAFGPAGGEIIGIIVAIAALTSMNATMIVGARSNHAVAQDWPAFAFMSRWRGASNVPVTGFLVQAAVSLGLIGFGALEKSGFSAMVEFTAPVFWFFFMLSGIALFVLRRREPHAVRPFKVPFYPLTPLVFVATTAYLLYSSITYAQSQQAVHIALYVMAAGVVAWGLTRRRTKASGP